MKKYFAEFLGVFVLVFVGAGSILADAQLATVRVTDSFGPLGIAIAHGLALAAAMAAVMHISGGHVNPAISIAFWVARRLSLKDLVGYVVFQLLGAIVAAFLLKAIIPAEVFKFEGGGIPDLTLAVPQGAALEAILTFFLVLVFWGVAVDRRGPASLAPFAIGLVLTFDLLIGGPFSGAAVNPARWLGPAVAARNFGNALVWTVGPILGALLASLLYETLFAAEPEEGIEEEEEAPEEVPVAAPAFEAAEEPAWTPPEAPRPPEVMPPPAGPPRWEPPPPPEPPAETRRPDSPPPDAPDVAD